MDRKSLLVAVWLAVAGLTGCRSGEAFPDLHPLTGTVTRDGKPVAGGGLIFLPDPPNGSGLVVNASVRADGTFAAETSRTTGTGTEIRQGVPAGTYKAIYHPPGDGQKTGLDVTAGERVTVPAGGGTAIVALPTALPAGKGADRDDDPKSTRFDPKRKD